jgi:hypothetical protein
MKNHNNRENHSLRRNTSILSSAILIIAGCGITDKKSTEPMPTLLKPISIPPTTIALKTTETSTTTTLPIAIFSPETTTTFLTPPITPPTTIPVAMETVPNTEPLPPEAPETLVFHFNREGQDYVCVPTGLDPRLTTSTTITGLIADMHEKDLSIGFGTALYNFALTRPDYFPGLATAQITDEWVIVPSCELL